jgi:hypothetical protein
VKKNDYARNALFKTIRSRGQYSNHRNETQIIMSYDSQDSFSEESRDSFTEETSQSWLGRLGESIKAVTIGFLLFLVAFPFLWWNDSRAVRTAGGLREPAHEVVSVEANTVDATNNEKSVSMTALATSDETLTDPVFRVATKGIKLARRVAMYQWQARQQSEKQKKLGGGTETITTYTYDMAWSSDPKDPSLSNE